VCTFPISALKTTPYNLGWGVSVFAKLLAVNMYGNSVASLEGNGGIILTVPDAPTDLANNVAITSASQIGLTWNQGIENGGT
jgi:hypothetical protein